MAYGLVDRFMGRKPSAEEATDAADATPAPERDPMRGTRRALLDAIASFILEHDLEVTADTLTAAYSAFSGSAPWLARSIAAHTGAGHPITGQWLAVQHSGPRRRGDHDAPFRLAEELDRSLNAFARNSGSARDATSKFSSELDRHVAELAGVDTKVAAGGLATLAGRMAERARLAEAQLRESEREANDLRRRLDRARHDAERDHLTGLPNRRAFEFVFQREYEEAKAHGESLSVAFCDVDHFKGINDRHGHDTGDRILKFIADTLATISNNKCHVARHGGEEFVLLFRGYTIEEAAQRLNEAREDLAGRKLINRHTEQAIGQISFSAGLADVWHYPGQQEALRAADEALLCAKASGRNRVVIAAAPGTI